MWWRSGDLFMQDNDGYFFVSFARAFPNFFELETKFPAVLRQNR